MRPAILKEVTPLTKDDCFLLFARTKSEFDFPVHYHDEYELNFLRNAAMAERIVGDSSEYISDVDLVLVGPNLKHAWLKGKCKSQPIQEITIQFQRDLFEDHFLHRKQMVFIRQMLERSSRGIAFSKETLLSVESRILALRKKSGFDSILELMSILHDLSISRSMRILSNADANSVDPENLMNERIQKALQYLNKNFDKAISLGELAQVVNMTEVSLSRFFKQYTGTTFIDCLTDKRLGQASRMLIDTSLPIAEIAYNCGFTNISNFNRIFKRKKGCTPKNYRDNYSGTRIFI